MTENEKAKKVVKNAKDITNKNNVKKESDATLQLSGTVHLKLNDGKNDDLPNNAKIKTVFRRR